MKQPRLRAIIVDDEERARNSLQKLVNEFCPGVEIVGLYANVPEAAKAIEKNHPQLVFLDVEMPKYNGFELFDFVQEIDFEVVFVTAYDQFAIQAFEVSATAYLLKPVEIEKLQRAVQLVETKWDRKQRVEQMNVLRETYQGEEIQRIALPMSERLTFVELKSVLYLEADGAYTRFFLTDGTSQLVSKRLKIFEDMLAEKNTFFRVHRSYLVNLKQIKNYLRGQNSLVMESGAEIPLSRDKKNEFDTMLKRLELMIG